MSACVLWPASLSLELAQSDGRTVLVGNRHSGPLRVQRLLQPHADLPAEAVLLHPPGGMAGGDAVRLDVLLRQEARCLLTTPGATRWYRSTGAQALQRATLTVAPGARLEWLPQDSIVQAGANGNQQLHVDLHGDARALGIEVVQLGQAQAGRPWQHGDWQQRFELRRDQRLLLAEQLKITAEEFRQPSPQGLAGHPVLGMLWASGPELGQIVEPLLTACRSVVAADPAVVAGVSWLEAPVSCLVVRALGHDAQALRQRLLAVWALLRPVLIGCPARPPRIWAT